MSGTRIIVKALVKENLVSTLVYEHSFSDTKHVEPLSPNHDSVPVGTDITAVFWKNRRAKASRTHVVTEAPMYVSCDGPVEEDDFPEPALLLWKRGEEIFMADARATHTERIDDETLVGMTVDSWRQCDDRRRYPRVPLQASVALRLIHEDSDEIALEAVYGRTNDLSMSGAMVQVPENLQVGQLVEFHAVLTPGTVVRALSVVARRSNEPAALGIAFLEFLGDGHTDLERFLAQVA